MRRLAASYFLMFMTTGVYVPWLPPLLEARGLSPRAIGLSLALVSVSRAIFPPLWGRFADRVQRKSRILSVAALAAGAAVLGLWYPQPSILLLFLLFLFGFFLVPVLPLLETLTLEGLGARRDQYGPVRLWGSLGFILASWGLGIVLGPGPTAGSSEAPARLLFLVPLAAGLPLIAVAALALFLPTPTPAPNPRPRPRLGQLPWRFLVPLLLAAMFGQSSHGPYYAFFTLQLKSQGESAGMIGLLWAIGVAAEVVLMAISPRFLLRLGLVRAMRWALVLSMVRWVVLAFDPDWPVVAVFQTFHAASYALLHLASLQLLDQTMPTDSRAFGQTLLSAAAYGIGIGGGLALSGQFVGSLGYSGLYGVAGLVSLFGLLCTIGLSQNGKKVSGYAQVQSTKGKF